MPDLPDIQSVVKSARESLNPTSTTADLDAEVLLCYVLDKNRAYLKTWPEKTLSHEHLSQFEQLIKKRSQGTPIAYLTGKQEFWSLELAVNSDTLIPRPETELLVEYILEKFGDKKTCDVIDLGTGSGAIALALASEKPQWKITATDVSDATLAIAIKNADNLNIKNITFIKSDWFTNITPHHFDIVVSNPPYIVEGDKHLTEGDVQFEPSAALSSGPQGLNAIERIADRSRAFLRQKGCLVLEHGYDQKILVKDCLCSAGYTPIHQLNDLAGNARLSAGYTP